MKRFFLALTLSLVGLLLGCSQSHPPHKLLVFATSAEYPPFEFHEQGEIKGFDIDLGRLIAKKLGKEALFQDLKFSTILPALNANQVDAAIATLSVTEERQKEFDFTQPYYFNNLALVSKTTKPFTSLEQLEGKKVAVQLGSAMEVWLKKQKIQPEILLMDANNQAIEALKAGHVDAVLVDGIQGMVFSKKNPGLSFTIIGKTKDGYALALKKNSPLTAEINQALTALEQEGALKDLKKKWLEDTSKWNP